MILYFTMFFNFFILVILDALIIDKSSYKLSIFNFNSYKKLIYIFSIFPIKNLENYYFLNIYIIDFILILIKNNFFYMNIS